MTSFDSEYVVIIFSFFDDMRGDIWKWSQHLRHQIGLTCEQIGVAMTCGLISMTLYAIKAHMLK
jgi:hypothetical protein